MTPQDGLYTRLLVEGEKADARVIGSIRRVLDADREPGQAAMAALADPGIDVVTMTVTEKGYCHVPSSGVLDWDEARDRGGSEARHRAAVAAGFPRRNACRAHGGERAGDA